MTPEIKLRTLASQNAGMQAIFGGGSPALFRWFDIQVPQGYVAQATCARLQRISTGRLYSHGSFASEQSASGLVPTLNLSAIRFQLDVIASDTEVARQAAITVINWLGTVSLAETNQFDSPVTTPPQFPCFVLNQRHGLYPDTQPPLPVVSIDFRAFNFEES